MIKYPKIDTLYKREFTERDPVTGEIRYLKQPKGGKNKLIIGDYAVPEFESIKYWTVTEKLDGTNIRIEYISEEILSVCEGMVTCVRKGRVEFGGRTDNASIPATLVRYLTEVFTAEKMEAVFPSAKHVILFGEGVGGKINLPEGEKVSPYGVGCGFVLFDAIIDGWWLEQDKIRQIAKDLSIKSVPLLEYCFPGEKVGDISTMASTFIWTKEQIEEFIKTKPKSLRYHHNIEGVVARSWPQMFFRDRDKGPIMFKLKVRDYE
jgi:hypothetical protein